MGDGFLFDTGDSGDAKYTRKVQIPQYEPRGAKPSIHSLVDRTKYIELLREIEESDLGEDEKEFLRLASARHLVFDYSLIADYYAHASEEMQRLMERSALVVIDLDDAIANGYAKLSKALRTLALGGSDEG